MFQKNQALKGRYHLREKIGEGGFAIVWRAEDIFQGQPLGMVAIKEFKERVDFKEIQTLSSLNHPHIIAYRTVEEHDGTGFMVIELAVGGNLLNLLKGSPQGIPLDQAEAYLRQVLEALDYLHSRGIVHRDVKPANILLSEDGNAKVSDVGLAKAAGEFSTRHSGTHTLAYMAPEMADGRVSVKSDIYSLGVTAYELITGRLPFDGNPSQILLGHLQKAPDIPVGLPEKWKRFLSQCLEKDPGRRPSAGQAADLLAETEQIRSVRKRPLSPRAVSETKPPGGNPPETRQPVGNTPEVYVEPITGMKFNYIPPGRFMMGSPASEAGRYDNETLHEVMLTKGFYMGVTPVTQAQWQKIMGANPSRFKDGGGECPVETVSWDDCQEFIGRLNQKTGAAKFRLPTEAEWEYACRAGSKTAYCFGDNKSRLGEYAWYSHNSGNQTHPVGQKKPNAWGLYDMHGNVWEWCGDWYGNFAAGSVTDPTGPSSGSYRVGRGGDWCDGAQFCRSALRRYYSPGGRRDGFGARLLRTAD